MGDDTVFELDLGDCPFCGAVYEVEAKNGRARGRKAPDACCARGTARTVLWLQAWLGRPLNERSPWERHYRAELEEDIRRYSDILRQKATAEGITVAQAMEAARAYDAASTARRSREQG